MRLLFLLGLLALISGCLSDDPTARSLINGELDRFEDGNLLSAAGRTWQPVREGATRANVRTIAGGPADSQYAMHIEAVRPGNAAPSHVAGVRLDLTAEAPPADPDQRPRPRDLDAYTGLRFAARGTPGSYVVQIGTAAVTDYDYPNAYVQLTEDWKTFELPFDAFAQEGFGRAVPFDASDVTHLALYGLLNGRFSFEIDDVVFY